MVRQRALVLEDEYLVALDIETTLLGMGFDTVDIALETHASDCVFLDVNIAGENSFDLARALGDRQIPFGFISGYNDTSGFPDDLKQAVVLGKPFDDGEFATFVTGILDDHEKRAASEAR
jgi:two-component SAPR family response regulator